jgi:hypothetical protein
MTPTMWGFFILKNIKKNIKKLLKTIKHPN